MTVREFIVELKKQEQDKDVIFFVSPDFNLEYEMSSIESCKDSEAVAVHLDF